MVVSEDLFAGMQKDPQFSGAIKHAEGCTEN
jgi:hypothetical protein